MRLTLRATLTGIAIALCGFGGDALAVSFSIDGISPAVTTGLGAAPDEIYVEPGPVATPALPPAPLLIPGSGSAVELDALSFGLAPSFFSTSALAFFGVDRGTSGVASSALAIEFGFAFSEQSSDIFSSSYTGTNGLFRDGDVDAMDLRGTVLSGGSPTGIVFTSFSTGSASGAGLSGADVLLGGLASPLYAPSVSLGLLPGDDIDALVVFDNGDGIFSPGIDIVLFSLAPSSPTLTSVDPIGGLLVMNEGDILIDDASAVALLGSLGGSAGILHTAESLGLFTTRGGAPSNGNLNALDLAAVVPEPATGCMLALGCMGLAWLSGRRGSHVSATRLHPAPSLTA